MQACKTCIPKNIALHWVDMGHVCRCAAAHFISCAVGLVSDSVELTGGVRFVKPLLHLLRKGDANVQRPAMTALHLLAQDKSCLSVMSGVRLRNSRFTVPGIIRVCVS